MKKFIVASTKISARGESLYTLVGDSVLQSYSSMRLEPYDIVELGAENYDGVSLGLSSLKGAKATHELYEEKIDALVKKVTPMCKQYSSGIQGLDDSVARLGSRLEMAGKALVRNFISGAPIFFRFHNDGDGSSGAIALYMAFEKLAGILGFKSVNCLWTMNRNVAYTQEAFEADSARFSNYESIEKPIVCAIDFGTAQESKNAIKSAKGKAKLVWIDHHPLYSGFAYSDIDVYVNPWLEGGDSNTTAGYLAGALAHSISCVNVSRFMKASLISDHSVYGKPEKKANEMALFLDSITMHETFDGKFVTPKNIINAMSDEAIFSEVIDTASGELDQAMAMALQKSKIYRHKDYVVSILNYKYIEDLGLRFVKHGKFASLFQDKIEKENGKKAVCIVYNKALISIRVNKDLSAKAGLLDLIGEMRDIGHIENGGGHNEAASMKVNDVEHMQDSLDYIRSSIESNLG
ncbi:hypothetical protein M1373_02000 [Candidatus Marsarchaeota archaeon]|nr:hypothetical protein [Candidatus Marsarchaeota archaeon]MCL5404365.1 hypothetical protein [Candidatus Marsarchaeota archaeon]